MSSFPIEWQPFNPRQRLRSESQLEFEFGSFRCGCQSPPALAPNHQGSTLSSLSKFYLVSKPKPETTIK